MEGHQVCTHHRWPPIFKEILKSFWFLRWLLATQSFSSLHRFSIRLKSEDCLGYSMTLMCVFGHSFVALAVFCVTVMLEDPFMIHLQCSGWRKEIVIQDFTVHGPSLKSSCTLSRKTAPVQNVSTSMLDCSIGVHNQHFSYSKYGELNWCQIVWFWFLLTTALPPKPSNLRWACTCGFLSRGSFWVLQDFNLLHPMR